MPILDAVLAGRSPVLVAAVGGSAIALLVLYLAHGWRTLTHVAAIGTFAALAITVVLSALVMALAVEIVRTLVGSIGLVAAVPVTTWLGARLANSENRA